MTLSEKWRASTSSKKTNPEVGCFCFNLDLCKKRTNSVRGKSKTEEIGRFTLAAASNLSRAWNMSPAKSHQKVRTQSSNFPSRKYSKTRFFIYFQCKRRIRFINYQCYWSDILIGYPCMYKFPSRCAILCVPSILFTFCWQRPSLNIFSEITA